MANIKVDVDYTIKDGSEVSFTAPCDCTAVTGLKVYHHGGSKVFTFRDSLGNNLIGTGNLFAAGAIVKVILNVTNGHAYIQNADTNAYLEAQFNSKQKLIGISQYTGDLNDYETLMNTVVWINGGSVANSPTKNYAVVETWGNGSGVALQRVTTASHNIALSVRYNSKWSEQEWLNPPMNIGTEYRLIEKWNGKAVYCKVISCGALVAAGSRKTVSIGQAGITRIVRHCGYAVYGSSAGEAYKGTPVSLPIYGGTGLIGYHAVAAEGLIYIECIGDGTEFTSSYITLWYTKD